MRAHEFKDTMKNIYDRLPSAVPLFGRYQADIRRSMDSLGVDLPGVGDELDKEMFKWLKDNAAYRPVGRRTHMGRFCAAPHSLVANNKRWGVNEFETTVTCLEKDFFSSRALIQNLVTKDAEKLAKKEEKKDEEKVAMAAPSVDAEVIRGLSRNAPVVAYQMIAISKRFIIISPEEKQQNMFQISKIYRNN